SAVDLEPDLVPGLVPADAVAQLLVGRDLPAVEADDDVAADPVRDAANDHPSHAALEARLVRTAALLDLLDEKARRDRKLEQPGELLGDRRDRDADGRVLGLPGLDDLGRDVADRVDRDREPDADVALLPGRTRRDLRGDADHATGCVDQRAARVAVVDRCIRLDRVVDRDRVRRLDLTLDGAYEPARQRPREAE